MIHSSSCDRASSLCLGCVLHLNGCGIKIAAGFAFPDAQHLPARLGQSSIRRKIAGTIGASLRSPTVRVGASKLLRPVLGTVMPEAAIDKDRQVIPRQHKIGRISTDSTIQAKPEAVRVHRLPQRDFGLGIHRSAPAKVCTSSSPGPAGLPNLSRVRALEFLRHPHKVAR